MSDRSNVLAHTLAQMDAQRGDLEAMMPMGVTFEELRSVASHAMRQDPKILDCSPASIMAALMRAAYDGINPDGNHAIIIPRNIRVSRNPDKWEKRAHYMVMIAGLRMAIIRDSRGLIHDVQATIVYQNEAFRYIGGLDPKIEHEICPDSDRRGDALGVYAFARYTNGQPPTFDYLTRYDIAQIRAKADDKSKVWDEFPDQMWKKSAVRRLRKSLPLIGPARDAEAMDMFHRMRGLPAPAFSQAILSPDMAPAEAVTARPRREDYVAIEHGSKAAQMPPLEIAADSVDTRETVKEHARNRVSDSVPSKNQQTLPDQKPVSLLEWEELSKMIATAVTVRECEEIWNNNARSIHNMSEDQRAELNLIYTDRIAEIAADAFAPPPGADADHQGGE